MVHIAGAAPRRPSSVAFIPPESLCSQWSKRQTLMNGGARDWFRRQSRNCVGSAQTDLRVGVQLVLKRRLPSASHRSAAASSKHPNAAHSRYGMSLTDARGPRDLPQSKRFAPEVRAQHLRARTVQGRFITMLCGQRGREFVRRKLNWRLRPPMSAIWYECDCSFHSCCEGRVECGQRARFMQWSSCFEETAGIGKESSEKTSRRGVAHQPWYNRFDRAMNCASWWLIVEMPFNHHVGAGKREKCEDV